MKDTLQCWLANPVPGPQNLGVPWSESVPGASAPEPYAAEQPTVSAPMSPRSFTGQRGGWVGWGESEVPPASRRPLPWPFFPQVAGLRSPAALGASGLPLHPPGPGEAEQVAGGCVSGAYDLGEGDRRLPARSAAAAALKSWQRQRLHLL